MKTRTEPQYQPVPVCKHGYHNHRWVNGVCVRCKTSRTAAYKLPNPTEPRFASSALKQANPFSDPLALGYDDAIRGQARHQNPYVKAGESRDLWSEGWDAGHEDLLKKERDDARSN